MSGSKNALKLVASAGKKKIHFSQGSIMGGIGSQWWRGVNIDAWRKGTIVLYRLCEEQ